MDASPYIDAIFWGRFSRSCQPETILLLGLGTTEPQLNQPILWGVRGAESKVSNAPKLGQKVRKKCISLHALFSEPPRSSRLNRPKSAQLMYLFACAFSEPPRSSRMNLAKNAPKIHIFAYSVTVFSAAPSQFTNEPPPRFLGLLPCFPLRGFLRLLILGLERFLSLFFTFP